VAVSVLIDASLVRTILVPAVMSLLGQRAWWLPRWPSWLPRLDIEGGAAPTSPAPVSSPAEAKTRAG
jgi:RND superfamily putative drug exporter